MRLVQSDTSLRFRKEIKKHAPIPIVGTVKKVRRMGLNWIGFMDFEIAEGKAGGNLKIDLEN